ncbi:hypothetical protein MP228_004682 [Amoeboaphelidium protococcarum]|nr:hypothetical protein MP228_004682 [Amoeboaphelidium protococcarum]
MLVLICGNLNIPNRSVDLPNKFKKLLTPGKIGAIICNGNLVTRETFDFLKSISHNLHTVRSIWDSEDQSVPDYKVVSVENVKIGVVSSIATLYSSSSDVGAGEMLNEELGMTARQLDVNILVYNDETAVDGVVAFERDNTLFLNPGMCSQVRYNALTGSRSIVPSFALLDVKPESVTVYMYKYIASDDSVKVDKMQFQTRQSLSSNVQTD